MFKADDDNLNRLPLPGAALNTLPGGAIPFSGVAGLPKEKRYAHVINRAKERGGLAITTHVLAAIEDEILHVRRLAQEGKPKNPNLARRIRKNVRLRRDVYLVTMRGAAHPFVWSRACAGIISYGSRLETAYYTWKKRSQPAQTP